MRHHFPIKRSFQVELIKVSEAVHNFLNHKVQLRVFREGHFMFLSIRISIIFMQFVICFADNSDNCSSLTRRRKRYDSNANLYTSSADDDDSGVGSTNGSRPSSRSSSSSGITNRFLSRCSSPVRLHVNRVFPPTFLFISSVDGNKEHVG